MAMANSMFVRQNSSRSRFARHALVRQAAEQYRRDFRLPSGSSTAH
jgi:hypothetical protein